MEEFDKFWAAYPRRASKGHARRAFITALKSVTLEEMLNALHAQKLNRAYLLQNHVFVPEWKYPATWLRGECWGDELRAVEITCQKIVHNVRR